MPLHLERTIIDLTRPQIDHFTALPSELIHEIISYLLPNHDPDIAFYGRSFSSSNWAHPIAPLAATCKDLEAEVNQWAQHFFKQHAAIMKVKTPKSESKPRKNWLHGRNGLLNWIETNCVFCGKKSVRAAILANGLKCCSACDRKEWPDKITKTEAKRAYDLKDWHLLPHRHGLVQNDPMGVGFPRLWYGTYMSSNVATTMFLREDARRLADWVHGGIEEHLKRKVEVKEERARRKKEKAERRV